MAERRVLICGFGAFGRQHALAWRQAYPDVRLSVFDPNDAARVEARAMGFTAENGDLHTLIGAADIIDIVAPLPHHLPIARITLGIGRPLLLEKPAVQTVTEAEELVAIAGKTLVQIGLVLRCHPLTLRAAALLQAGAIGELRRCEGDFSGWKRMRGDSTLMENDGVHFIDLMRMFARAPISAVDSHSTHVLDADVADDIRVNLAFANGITGHLRVGVLVAGEGEDGFVPGATTTKRLILIGTAGNLALDFNAGTLRNAGVFYHRIDAGFEVYPGAATKEFIFGATPVSLLASSFEIFMRALDTGSAVMADVTQGALEVSRVLAALSKPGSVRTMRQIDGDSA